MTHLEWIKPANIRELWPTIKPGIEKVESLSKEWIAEDVYLSLKLGTCNLHIVTIDGEYEGFIVTQQQDNHSIINLHIWIAYSKKNNHDMVVECMDSIKQWAEKIDAKYVTFGSVRKGFARQAIEYGFKASPLITYKFELGVQ